jgi:hypothetical protein
MLRAVSGGRLRALDSVEEDDAGKASRLLTVGEETAVIAMSSKAAPKLL